MIVSDEREKGSGLIFLVHHFYSVSYFKKLSWESWEFYEKHIPVMYPVYPVTICRVQVPGS